jgi:hypothetical protein
LIKKKKKYPKQKKVKIKTLENTKNKNLEESEIPNTHQKCEKL